MRNTRQNIVLITKSTTEERKRKDKRIIKAMCLAVFTEFLAIVNMNTNYTEEVVKEAYRIEQKSIQEANIRHTRYEEIDNSFTSLEKVALLVYQEAGNQDDKGKRLVADVVFNRVEDERFPDNIHDVIFQDNPTQFTPAYKLYENMVDEEILQLVIEEYENRTDTDVLYFCSTGYIENTTPLYKHGDHYFSK